MYTNKVKYKLEMRFDLSRFMIDECLFSSTNLSICNYIIWFKEGCRQQPPRVRVLVEEYYTDFPEFNFSRGELLKILSMFGSCDICYSENFLEEYPIKIDIWVCHNCCNSMCSNCEEKVEKNSVNRVLKCPFCRHINLGLSTITLSYETNVKIIDESHEVINVYDELDICIVMDKI